SLPAAPPMNPRCHPSCCTPSPANSCWCWSAWPRVSRTSRSPITWTLPKPRSRRMCRRSCANSASATGYRQFFPPWMWTSAPISDAEASPLCGCQHVAHGSLQLHRLDRFVHQHVPQLPYLLLQFVAVVGGNQQYRQRHGPADVDRRGNIHPIGPIVQVVVGEQQVRCSAEAIHLTGQVIG